jgi:hypothetical protein
MSTIDELNKLPTAESERAEVAKFIAEMTTKAAKDDWRGVLILALRADGGTTVGGTDNLAPMVRACEAMYQEMGIKR